MHYKFITIWKEKTKENTQVKMTKFEIEFMTFGKERIS